MLLVLFSCTSEITPVPSGEELLENYFDSVCQLYTEAQCISEFASCNAPVSSYSGWDYCMNDFQSRYGSCSILSELFLQENEIVSACISTLQEAECVSSDICPDDSIIRTGECGEVSEILTTNCAIF